METIYEINPTLTKEQRALKEAKDKEYEADSKALSEPYYEKKRTIGVTSLETAEYEAAYKALWETYQSWAVDNNIFFAVTPEDQLSRGEALLQELLSEVNSMRQEFDKSPLSLK